MLPSRIVFYGVEGIGKTSLGAHAPNPIFGMSLGETGLLTLLDNGRLAPTPHFDEWSCWGEALDNLDFLLRNPNWMPDRRCLVLDTGNGLERLCHDHVCDTQFQGDRGQFMAFAKGPDVALPTWTALLTLLDKIRAVRKMGVIMLCHAKVKKFSNPEGEDYDRYTVDMDPKTWSLTHKWADIVLFGNYKTEVKKNYGQMKAKGTSDQGRHFFTRRMPAFDAKNRHGLPDTISMGKKPVEGWNNLAAALKKSREAGVQPENIDEEPNEQPAEQQPVSAPVRQPEPAQTTPPSAPQPTTTTPPPVASATPNGTASNGTPQKPLLNNGKDLDAYLTHRIRHMVSEGHLSAPDIRTALLTYAQDERKGAMATWDKVTVEFFAIPFLNLRFGGMIERDAKPITADEAKALEAFIKSYDCTLLDAARHAKFALGSKSRVEQLTRQEAGRIRNALTPAPVGAN